MGATAVAFGQWVGFLGVAIALYILWEIRHIVLLIFAAVVLARALNGVARWLQGFRISRGIAVFLTILLTFLVMVLFVGLIVPPFLGEFQELVRLLPKGLNQLQDWFNALWSGIPNWFPQAPEIPMISEFFSGLQLSTAEYQWLFAFFQNTLALMLRILLVLVLALMLLSNPQAYRQAFLQIFPSFYRRRADYILSECDTILGSWLAGILFNSLFIGCLSGLGLWLLGVGDGPPGFPSARVNLGSPDILRHCVWSPGIVAGLALSGDCQGLDPGNPDQGRVRSLARSRY